ncbi:phage tail protein [Gemmiger formicilis]
MSVSGSVRINTRLDNSQLMKDCRALKTVVTEVANAVKRAFHGREIQALEQQMEATREAMSPIVQELTEIENRASAAGKNSARDFQKAQAEAGKLQQQYDALLNKISEYEAKARAPFDAQLVTYKPTQTDLANNAAVEQQYAAAMASDQVYQKMIADAEQLRAKQYQVNQTVQQMKQAADDAGGTSSARYTELQGELEALRGRTQDLNDQLRNLGVTGNNTGGMIAAAIGGAASRAFSTLQKGARSVLKTFGTLVKSGIGKITSSLAQSGKGLQTFLNRLGSIAAGALVFNVISAGLRNMTNYMGQALLSSASLRTALGNLSGAAQTAAAPLIQVLTPALTALASAAATVFGYIAQLVSFLTGTTVSAASDAAAGVAGVGSAAEETAQQVKDASKSLAGFDELERLSEPQQDTGSGGGGGAGASQIVPNYDFQGKSPFLDSILDAIKAGDWYQVGELVAQKLNEGMAAIDWGPIDATAIRWATNLYNGLNGAVQNLDWGLLGSTIGNGLNTVLHFIDTFFQGFDWVTLGAGIGTGLNGLFATIDWAALGRVLSDKFMALLQTLHGFVQTFDWAALGLDVAAMLSAALANIDWVQAAGDLGTLAIGILTAINTALSQADWSSVGQTIMGMFAAIDWLGLIQQLVELLANTWPLVLTAVLIPALSAWITGTLLPAIGAWITEVAIPAILGWLGSIVASIVSTIGLWPALLIAAIVALFAALVAVIVSNWEDICDWFSGKWDDFVAGWNDFWDSVAFCAQEWWKSVTTEWTNFWNGIVDKFNALKSGLSQAWDAFWTGLSDRVGDIWNGIVNTVKGAVNSLIGFINGMISAVVGGLNSAIDALNSLSVDIPDWVPVVGGNRLGFSIGHVTAPQIPYLAQGAVIPANREFLAVLGDQSHGTNVEAPLDTIKQAVAEVMEDLQAGQMAGFEAVVSVLREILSAVYGIELTDEDVGRAVQRWQRKQLTATGGV